MAWLPNMVYADGIRKQTQIKFGGYDHRIGAEDGSVWDEKNMSSRVYPVMEPRKPRYTVRQLTTPNGYYIHDGVHYWADGTELFKDGKKIGNVKNSKKVFASLGKYIAIWPDKLVYHTEEETLEPVESTWTGAAKIQNGTFHILQTGKMYNGPCPENKKETEKINSGFCVTFIPWSIALTGLSV